MIIDKLNELSDDQDGSSFGTGDNISTNAIDTDHLHDIGPGEELVMRFLVKTTVTSAGAATIDFQIVTDTAAAMSTPTVVASSGAISKATLVAGYHVDIPIPKSGVLEQFLAGNCSVGAAALTAGDFDIFIVKDVQQNETYI